MLARSKFPRLLPSLSPTFLLRTQTADPHAYASGCLVGSRGLDSGPQTHRGNALVPGTILPAPAANASCVTSSTVHTELRLLWTYFLSFLALTGFPASISYFQRTPGSAASRPWHTTFPLLPARGQAGSSLACSCQFARKLLDSLAPSHCNDPIQESKCS